MRESKLNAFAVLVDRLVAKGVTPDIATDAAVKVITTETQRLLTAEETGALLNRDPKTILAWARDGTIPCVKAKGCVVGFSWRTVLEAMSTKARNPRK